ncbi:MAG: tetratricopeptide repeat protein [Sphingopyxis sp.]|uniref:tetratricopeptide repeat protein n=1 Tax=Sphingopyxis sp. TaxID=1908224 RepID=UPI003D6CD59C
MDRTKASADQDQDQGEIEKIIADELTQLLESPMFVRSPVLTRLLQYLVDHRLQGNRTAPKAYAIATEALGRSADFDPAIDSYPRVMVGRLRNLLDRYYAETPWLHRLRVPQGSYEIVVQYRSAPPSSRAADAGDAPIEGQTAPGGAAAVSGAGTATPQSLMSPLPPKRRAIWLWLGFVVALALAAFGGWWFAHSNGRLLGKQFVAMPTIEMSMPASGDTGPSRAMARGLDSKLRDGLRRFELIQLRSARAPADGARPVPADYRLDASIVRALDGDSVDVTLVLNRVADDRAIWSQQIRVTLNDIPEFRGLEPAIAQMAGDYGVIVRDQLQREPDNFAPGYPCLAQFNRLRQMRTPAAAQRTDRCLRATLADMPGDPVPLSLLRFGDWQQLRATPKGKAAFAEAQDLAQRAYTAAPNSAPGIFAMARAHFYVGSCQRGVAMGNAAVELNPYDPDLAGFMGLFKTSCGLLADGEALLTRSVMLDDSHAGVPAVTLAFLRSQRGEQAEALALLDRMPSPSNLEPQYLMVRSIVLARMGKVEQARALWRRLLAYTRQPAAAPPEMVLRQFMITPAVIARASIALRESGVVGPKVAPPPAGARAAD